MTATTLSVEDEARRRFEAETARHGMIILHDDGVYRHLRFMDEKGSSLYWYDLVTWPGSLAFNGDYGSFVFSRSRDMFEFFPRSASSGINAWYWSEKLRAPAGRDAVRVWSPDRYRQLVEEWRDSHEEDMTAHDVVSFGSAVAESLLDDVYGPEDIGGAHRRLAAFEFQGLRVSDSWEWDLRDWDLAFLWACWGIVRGIERYRSDRGHGG
jgi:hypothetical protein